MATTITVIYFIFNCYFNYEYYHLRKLTPIIKNPSISVNLLFSQCQSEIPSSIKNLMIKIATIIIADLNNKQ